MKKILIVHTWGIGDLIMFTPALKILRDNFPDAVINVFIGQPVAGDVLQENHIVNKVLKFSWQGNNFFNKLKFIYQLRKEKYDLAIVTTGVNPFLGSLFTFLIGARFRVGEYRKNKTLFYTQQVRANSNKHKIDSNLDLLKTLGIEIKSIPEPFFETGTAEKEFAQKFLRENKLENKILFGFNPGGAENQKSRRWPKESFIELGKRILNEIPDAFILIFGGPGDETLCSEIKNSLLKNIMIVTANSLKQVVVLIDQCKIFISGDTGPSHIASTTKTNLIGLFGPTDPKRTGPIGPRVYIIKEKCSYPYNDLINPKYDLKKPHSCLKKITPDRVFNEIKKILEK